MKIVNILVAAFGLAVVLSVSACQSDKKSDNKPADTVNKADQKARENQFEPTKNDKPWSFH